MHSLRRCRYAQLAMLGVMAATVGCRRSPSGNAEPEGPNAMKAEARGASVDSAIARGVASLGAVLRPGEPGVVDVMFEINADQGATPVSPFIYGMNFNGKSLTPLHWGVIRCGGNRLTAYNWENNASNAGADYLFQNDGLMEGSDAPAKPLLHAIDTATGVAAATVITLSNADYVAADKNGNGDVRNSGPNYLSTRFKRNYPKKPTPPAALPDTTDNAVYQDELVSFLKVHRPHARVIFSMDNEPDLWAHTHAEIFSKPVTYADLWKRNHDFAKAAKKAWPEAEVLGFVSYGYLGFVSLQKAEDADGRNFIEWYLDQARAAEQIEGVRLIDYLDLHWYPEAQGGDKRIVGDEVDPEVVAARVQAPRSLWDSSYEEKSWVRDAAGGPIDLLHWVKAKVDARYPGTKLAFTEWNFGGGKHISGAVAVADVLGIFGRYGVGLATYWPMTSEEPFAVAAYYAFRNYDGQGSAFGDTQIAASTSNTSVASVYASIDSNDPTRTVIVAINKATTAKKAGIKVGHASAYGTARVWALTGKQAAVVSAPPLTAV
ncbi:MAG: hypothetical protein JWN04_4607, partial [Myxococcaceae bacterium]|nr:hypothetical protein [Myxococcaceae bacterium]